MINRLIKHKGGQQKLAKERERERERSERMDRKIGAISRETYSDFNESIN